MTLNEFRKSKGMTLSTLAGYLECSPSAISKYERNIETVPNDVIQKIKNKFGVTIEKQYNQLALYKQRIKDLESANQTLVNYGIKTEKALVAVQQELNNLLMAVNLQINKINKILKGE